MDSHYQNLKALGEKWQKTSIGKEKIPSGEISFLLHQAFPKHATGFIEKMR
jgi:hypothetical protein